MTESEWGERDGEGLENYLGSDSTSSHRVYGMTWATEPGCPLVKNLQSELDLKPSCLFKRLIMFNSRCKV